MFVEQERKTQRYAGRCRKLDNKECYGSETWSLNAELSYAYALSDQSFELSLAAELTQHLVIL